MPEQPEKTLVDVGAWKASIWFLQNGLDAFIALKDGQISWVGGAWTALTGWTAETVTGRLFADFLHPEDVAAAHADIAALAEGARSVFTYRIAGKTRGWLWMRHHAQRGEDGWVLMIARDITAEHQREIDNEAARKVAAMVRQTAGVSAWRYDCEADEYEIDPDFTDHAGRIAPTRRPGAVTRANMHPEDAPKVQAAWERSLATGEAAEVDYRSRAGNGLPWRHYRAAWQGVRKRASGRWDVLGVAED